MTSSHPSTTTATTPPPSSSSSSSLEELVGQLLRDVGVLKEKKTNGATNNKDSHDDRSHDHRDNSSLALFHRMDQWLGIDDDPNTTMMMMETDDDDEDDEEEEEMILTAEDCAPYPAKVYEIIATILVQSWDPINDTSTSSTSSTCTSASTASNSSTNLYTTNVFIQEFHHLLQQRQQQQNSNGNTDNSTTDTDNNNDNDKEDWALHVMKDLNCVPAFRVTQWVRQWMECNVEGGGGGGSTTAITPPRSFSQFLLLGRQRSYSDDNNNKDNNDNEELGLPNYTERLIQSLFIHMTLLPVYQSQLLLFNQAFQRGDITTIQSSSPSSSQKKNKNLLNSGTTTKDKQRSSSSLLQDPTKRLHHYQIAQQLSKQLTTSFQNHIKDIEVIVGEWYSICNNCIPSAATRCRPLIRAGIGKVWMKFITHNQMIGATSSAGGSGATGGSGISLRGENTSACGIDVTLRILLRILLGMSVLKNDNHDNNNNNNNNDNNNNNNIQSTSSKQQQQQQQQQVVEDLLFHQLLPLHQPNAMVLWRDQTSLLELYHEPLVQCMAHIFKSNLHWVGPICQALLLPSESIWPLGGNTPKQVLLLHEVDIFLGMLLIDKNKDSESKDSTDKGKNRDGDDKSTLELILDEKTFVSILNPIAQCMASEHSRLAERALALFRNAYFKQMVYDVHYRASLRVLLPALTRSSKATAGSETAKHAIPWNPTVRKMTFHVLRNLQQHKTEIFAQVCNQMFGDAPIIESNVQADEGSSSSSRESSPTKKSSIVIGNNDPEHQSTSPSSNLAFNQRFSLSAGMGNWKPPPSAKQQHRMSNKSSLHTNMPPPSARPPSSNRSHQPPSTVTGVAPWANSDTSKNPPLTVTGVAPWAAGNTKKMMKPPTKNNPPGRGVAPWANNSGSGIAGRGNRLPPGGNSSSQKRPGAPPITSMPPKQLHKPPHPPPLHQPSSQPEETKADTAPSISSTLPEQPVITEESEEDEKDEIMKNDKKGTTETNPGLAHVLYYMEQCKPPGMDENEDEHASSSWSKAQMSETPTLLPDLKFHDLVFGHELGYGAFGVVKYARLIDRTKTRSQWPEYAVKIISTEKMKELGYEYSVAREIACLHLISHPNVARLVSSFRFQQGAYLVLEYASGGDLHQLLQQHGSLDVPSCQFVMGEMVAALASLHDDLGFVYADLKPENIIISETGHVKLTDFGACRPFTEQAKAMLKNQLGKSGKNLLETLREGDPRKLKLLQNDDKGVIEEKEGEDNDSSSGWMATDVDEKHPGGVKPTNPINDDTMQIVDSDNEACEREDLRIEGTTAYLPPEVVMGTIPTPAADSWSFGCVLYQLLTGRPPLLEADEASTRNRIVTFENTPNGASMVQSEKDTLFGPEQKHAADISDTAKSLIRSLLDHVPTRRPNMQQIAQHDFFEGQDVMSLYQKQAYPLDVGDVAPAPRDAQWSRRQFSSIWAPQPQAYDISGAAAASLAGPSSTVSLTAPIPEGEESGSPFSASNFYRVNISRSRQNQSSDNEQSLTAVADQTNANGKAHSILPNIEEDDVSMASSEG